MRNALFGIKAYYVVVEIEYFHLWHYSRFVSFFFFIPTLYEFFNTNTGPYAYSDRVTLHLLKNTILSSTRQIMFHCFSVSLTVLTEIIWSTQTAKDARTIWKSEHITTKYPIQIIHDDSKVPACLLDQVF
jgi:hypothetical protein